MKLLKRIAVAGLTLLGASVPALAQSDSMEQLNADVNEVAEAIQENLRERAAEARLMQRMGTQAVIQGIDIGCDPSNNSAVSVADCLNALYGIPGISEEGQRALDPLRDRWRALQGLEPIESGAPINSGNIFQTPRWSVSIYPEAIQGRFETMRENCDSDGLASRDNRVACLKSLWLTTSGIADTTRLFLEESKTRTTDRATLRGLDQGIENIDEQCGPLLSFPGGSLEAIFTQSMDMIKTCVTEVGFAQSGHVEGFAEIAVRQADNSTPYYRALQDISRHALSLEGAM